MDRVRQELAELLDKVNYKLNSNLTVNILLVGVGGQGILKFSDLLSKACMLMGYEVKKAEVHGMAQRGGSVNSHIRYGRQVFSPLIPRGEVDILVSLEALETVRYIEYLNPEGVAFYDPFKWAPPEVYLGKREYPKVEAMLSEFRAFPVNAMEIAIKEIGNFRTQNVVMLGAISSYTGISEEAFLEAIRTTFKPKLTDINLTAFKLGRKLLVPALSGNLS